MKRINLENIKSNIEDVVKECVETDAPVIVETSYGNIVMLREEQFEGMIESLSRRV